MSRCCFTIRAWIARPSKDRWSPKPRRNRLGRCRVVVRCRGGLWDIRSVRRGTRTHIGGEPGGNPPPRLRSRSGDQAGQGLLDGDRGAVFEVLTEAGWTAADPILVTSFRPEALKVFHTYAAEYPRGLLIWEWPDEWLLAARSLDCVAVISDHKSLETEAHVKRITDEGFLAMTYTVNDRARAEQLLSWGVTSVVTDDPIALRGVQPRGRCRTSRGGRGRQRV